MKKTVSTFVLVFLTIFMSHPVFAQQSREGAEFVSSHGYTGCVKLFNDTVSVILEPNCGGRVLEYALNGNNVLYIDPAQDGWTYTPGGKRIGPCAGRFDIGPEHLVPGRPNLWLGKWIAVITGPRSARMTSVEDESTGVQLVREFVLAPDSSHLKCTQIIKNISNATKQYNHWSRTFAVGGGVCLVPLSEGSRFPLGYIYYGPGPILNYRHEPHPHINVRDNVLEITEAPPQKKFGIDSYAGWLGYVTPSDLLFVKKFPVYPDRVYGELAAYTISIWYNEDVNCELEPIGPRETIEPGESASFTEEWWLLPYEFPQGDEKVDIPSFTKYVADNTD